MIKDEADLLLTGLVPDKLRILKKEPNFIHCLEVSKVTQRLMKEARAAEAVKQAGKTMKTKAVYPEAEMEARKAHSRKRGRKYYQARRKRITELKVKLEFGNATPEELMQWEALRVTEKVYRRRRLAKQIAIMKSGLATPEEIEEAKEKHRSSYARRRDKHMTEMTQFTTKIESINTTPERAAIVDAWNDSLTLHFWRHNRMHLNSISAEEAVTPEAIAQAQIRSAAAKDKSYDARRRRNAAVKEAVESGNLTAEELECLNARAKSTDAARRKRIAERKTEVWKPRSRLWPPSAQQIAKVAGMAEKARIKPLALKATNKEELTKAYEARKALIESGNATAEEIRKWNDLTKEVRAMREEPYISYRVATELRNAKTVEEIEERQIKLAMLRAELRVRNRERERLRMAEMASKIRSGTATTEEIEKWNARVEGQRVRDKGYWLKKKALKAGDAAVS